MVRKDNVVQASVCLTLGVFYLINLLRYDAVSRRFPLAVAVVLLFLGLLLLAKGLFNKTAIEEKPHRSFKEIVAEKKHLAAFVILTIVYIAVIPLMGYYLTTFLYMVAVSCALNQGRSKYSFLGIFSLGFTITLFLLFTVWISLRLPKGLFL